MEESTVALFDAAFVARERDLKQLPAFKPGEPFTLLDRNSADDHCSILFKRELSKCLRDGDCLEFMLEQRLLTWISRDVAPTGSVDLPSGRAYVNSALVKALLKLLGDLGLTSKAYVARKRTFNENYLSLEDRIRRRCVSVWGLGSAEAALLRFSADGDLASDVSEVGFGMRRDVVHPSIAHRVFLTRTDYESRLDCEHERSLIGSRIALPVEYGNPRSRVSIVAFKDRVLTVALYRTFTASAATLAALKEMDEQRQKDGFPTYVHRNPEMKGWGEDLPDFEVWYSVRVFYHLANGRADSTLLWDSLAGQTNRDGAVVHFITTKRDTAFKLNLKVEMVSGDRTWAIHSHKLEPETLTDDEPRVSSTLVLRGTLFPRTLESGEDVLRDARARLIKLQPHIETRVAELRPKSVTKLGPLNPTFWRELCVALAPDRLHGVDCTECDRLTADALEKLTGGSAGSVLKTPFLSELADSLHTLQVRAETVKEFLKELVTDYPPPFQHRCPFERVACELICTMFDFRLA
ncbi:protein ORF28 [Anguillid herpesvirus 1]|uniref:Protein ORF28 n=1 Tax=Anguillid herpesvirus 1 TaxID=150286 RepID=A0A1J0RE64_9VIRU|nr:protein ORF28 [Anguillid herpesvirus 1]ADA57791.1 protein ORF28 [Anguillid herpesvirus 1]APD76191.1 ORF28 [Anguillid herpesvirus 1]QRM16322.1 protein ORF28 [Anguillid herpesvirus 1]QRM16452.1 protein ORF28 [Anguillid herpesvirus 1]QRM16581.1 protein ORF28 [Anguillid herpesvirus 1]